MATDFSSNRSRKEANRVREGKTKLEIVKVIGEKYQELQHKRRQEEKK